MIKAHYNKDTHVSFDTAQALFFESSREVINSLQQTEKLPHYYITKGQALTLGWRPGKALKNYAPGKALGGDPFDNLENKLPNKNGRIWYESDIGQDYSRRRGKNPPHRLLYSNDGLIYGTLDHYDSFFRIL